MENERAEWIWRMSERSGVDVENEQAGYIWTISEEDKILFEFAKIRNTL